MSTRTLIGMAAGMLLVGGVLFLSAPVHAQRAQVQPAAAYKPLAGQNNSAWDPVTNTWNLAFIGGTPILRVRSDWAGFDPRARAMMVQLRVNQALSVGPVHPDQITVGRLQGDWCVLFRGRRFLTADPHTAAIDHSTPRALAVKWAERMRHVLPALTYPTG